MVSGSFGFYFTLDVDFNFALTLGYTWYHVELHGISLAFPGFVLFLSNKGGNG